MYIFSQELVCFLLDYNSPPALYRSTGGSEFPRVPLSLTGVRTRWLMWLVQQSLLQQCVVVYLHFLVKRLPHFYLR